VAEAVVGGALLRVLEAIISFGERLELGLGVGAAAVAVRVAFHRELAVGGLDRRRIRAPRHLQQLVIVGFNHDDAETPSSTAPAPADFASGGAGAALA
jgi:hypothetical protein